MKNIALLLSLTLSPVFGFTSIFSKNQSLRKNNSTPVHIQEWYDTFSLKELSEQELTTIAKEIKLLSESDINRQNYEQFLVKYHEEILKTTTLHTECYQAVENACGHIVAFTNTSFKTELQEYLQKTHDALKICKAHQKNKVS